MHSNISNFFKRSTEWWPTSHASELSAATRTQHHSQRVEATTLEVVGMPDHSKDVNISYSIIPDRIEAGTFLIGAAPIKSWNRKLIPYCGGISKCTEQKNIQKPRILNTSVCLSPELAIPKPEPTREASVGWHHWGITEEDLPKFATAIEICAPFKKKSKIKISKEITDLREKWSW